MYRKIEYSILIDRIKASVNHIQMVVGPRQVGKTTMVKQVLETLKNYNYNVLYVSADLPAPGATDLIRESWNKARILRGSGKTVLVLDEIQKITNWFQVINELFQEEKNHLMSISVVLIDSSDLAKLVKESSIFDVIPMNHWSYHEMNKAFGFDLDKYLVYGGYPGGVPHVGNFDNWRKYMLDSLIETTLSRDILMMNRVEKPVLLRNLFMLACRNPNKIFSYTGMLVKLQDSGNTTTLANYLSILQGAGLIAGLQKYSGAKTRKRGSSPKLLPLNTALVCAIQGIDEQTLQSSSTVRDNLISVGIGASIYSKVKSLGKTNLCYWKSGNTEIDFVYESNGDLLAYEIYTHNNRIPETSFEFFLKEFPSAKFVQIGGIGLPVENAL